MDGSMSRIYRNLLCLLVLLQFNGAAAHAEQSQSDRQTATPSANKGGSPASGKLVSESLPTTSGGVTDGQPRMTVQSEPSQSAGTYMVPRYSTAPATLVPVSGAAPGLPGGASVPLQVESGTQAPASSPTTTPQLMPNAALSSGPQAPLYYVYDFSAKWCPSCRALDPFVKQTATKFKGFVEVIPVDVDARSTRSVVRTAELRAIPTVIISDREGHQLQRLVGLQQGLRLDRILTDYFQRANGATSVTR